VRIVDDHAGSRGFARRLLEAGGFTVVGDADTRASALGAVESRRRRLLLAVALAALATAVAAVLVSLLAPQPEHAAPLVEIPFGAVWIAAGLIAWAKRPKNRTGALMTAVGFLFLVTHLSWGAPLPFTLVVLVETWGIAVAIHLVVAFPSGRLSTRFERVVVAAAYLSWVVGNGIWLLFWNPVESGCADCPRNLLLLQSDSGISEGMELVGAPFDLAIVLTAFGLFIRRWRRATAPARRAFAPVGWAIVGLGLLLGAFTVWLGLTSGDPADSPFSWVVAVAAAAVPLAFLAGLLRTRLHRSDVAGLVVELSSLPSPAHARDAIARTLGDPSLELAFWLPEDGRYVDIGGRSLDPSNRPDRALSLVERNGNRIAALVHDPSLLDDPELVQAVGAAAGLAIENARLQAELRAQLAEVRASRARIVEAGDAERRRLERDLHDGAQQRLLAIRLALQLARGRLGDEGEVEEFLAEADTEVVGALEELRTLARGIHPPILTDEGLGPALAALARRAPVPVELDVTQERLPERVEATAYFVASEALANVAKHAHASQATIAVSRMNGRVSIEVADDGVGGADADGAGLRGLRDRVEALDGRLEVESHAQGGTRVTAAIPCE
jgi:signal transduction histidine kinase